MVKIVADVEREIKEKLEDLAHYSRSNMKNTIVRLIEEAYRKEVEHAENENR